MRAYRRDFDVTKYMYFLLKDSKLLEKYNEIWDEVSNTFKNGLNSEPVYNEKYLKIKINLIKEKTRHIFKEKKIPKEDSQSICLSVTLIDSVFKMVKNYYHQVSFRRI